MKFVKFVEEDVKVLNEELKEYFEDNELGGICEEEYEEVVFEKIQEFVKDKENVKFVFDEEIMDDVNLMININDEELYSVYIDEDFVEFMKEEMDD